MKTIRTVCAHDCPDQCSLLAQVDGDRVVKIQGDPDHPFTAGFARARLLPSTRAPASRESLPSGST